MGEQPITNAMKNRMLVARVSSIKRHVMSVALVYRNSEPLQMQYDLSK